MSGYFNVRYADDFALLRTRTQKAWLAMLLVGLGVYPFITGPLWLDLGNQVLLGCIGAVALMLLTGHAGQISLGHAGLLAAGAFTTGILFKEYETKRGFSTGIVIESPIGSARGWYFALLAAAAVTVLLALNLLRSRTGRAWRAIHGREAVAEALGISVQRAKLSAFIVSSTLTAVAGCLFAYYRGFVSAEAFSLYLTIQYVAMIIIGGMGSILGAVLGTVFVVLFPYAIDGGMALLGLSERLSSVVFAVNYSAFGLVMILFLVFEPQGLVGLWRRVQNWFLLWPFKQRPLAR